MSDIYLPGMSMPPNKSVCLLLSAWPGVMVLGHSLKDNGTRKELAVLVTLDSLQASTIDELKVQIHVDQVSECSS